MFEIKKIISKENGEVVISSLQKVAHVGSALRCKALKLYCEYLLEEKIMKKMWITRAWCMNLVLKYTLYSKAEISA
jgi:hypothetical protein